MGNTCAILCPPGPSDATLRLHEDAGAIPCIFKNEDEVVEKVSNDVHILVVALDYKKTKHPLSCTIDGLNIMDLARQSNVKDMVSLFDEEATKEHVSEKVQQMGLRCKSGDHFIFYYAGHGSNMIDLDHDEQDGFDEAYCLVDENGSLASSNWLRDDDFSKLITSSIPKGTNIIILSDSCHSGTIADFDRPEWDGYRAVSISGCTDAQTSGDTGRGGIFTHSMLLAIQQLNTRGTDGYSVGTLFRETLNRDNGTFHSAQDITIRGSSVIDCKIIEQIAWPCVPPKSYRAPWQRRRNRADVQPSGHITESGPASTAPAPVLEAPPVVQLPTLLTQPAVPAPYHGRKANKSVKLPEAKEGVKLMEAPVVSKPGCSGCFGVRS